MGVCQNTTGGRTPGLRVLYPPKWGAAGRAVRQPRAYSWAAAAGVEMGTHTARITAWHVDHWVPSTAGKYQSTLWKGRGWGRGRQIEAPAGREGAGHKQGQGRMRPWVGSGMIRDWVVSPGAWGGSCCCAKPGNLNAGQTWLPLCFARCCSCSRSGTISCACCHWAAPRPCPPGGETHMASREFRGSSSCSKAQSAAHSCSCLYPVHRRGVMGHMLGCTQQREPPSALLD